MYPPALSLKNTKYKWLWLYTIQLRGNDSEIQITQVSGINSVLKETLEEAAENINNKDHGSMWNNVDSCVSLHMYVHMHTYLQNI